MSFSGGRTSAYMLRRHLDAHGGSLPEERAVLFCNTGKELEETLVFVEECSQRWGTPIVWLEYRYTPATMRHTKAGKVVALASESHGFAVVDYRTASRRGEPFDQAIKARNDFRAAAGKPGLLPHVKGRFCTAELKTRTKGRYVHDILGWDTYHNAIGMRADEPERAAALTGCDYQTEAACWGEIPLCPLAESGVTERDVMEFWKKSRGGMPLNVWLDMPAGNRPGWDLALMQHEGNCDLCHLKGLAKIKDIIRRRPGVAEWWADQEAKTGDVFRQDRPTYAALKVLAPSETPSMFDDPKDVTIPCTSCTN